MYVQKLCPAAAGIQYKCSRHCTKAVSKAADGSVHDQKLCPSAAGTFSCSEQMQPAKQLTSESASRFSSSALLQLAPISYPGQMQQAKQLMSESTSRTSALLNA